MTVEQKEVGNIYRNGGTQGAVPVPLPERDVRRKKPPFLSFLLRWETLRRVARVISLLAIDFIGVVAALFTAVMVKLAVHGDGSASLAWHDVKHWIAFAYLITVLSFARVDLYSSRTRRPGLARIATALFQATVIALVFALADGQHFSSYFLFYGSLFFATEVQQAGGAKAGCAREHGGARVRFYWVSAQQQAVEVDKRSIKMISY